MSDGLSNKGFDIDLALGQKSEASLAHLLHYGKIEVKSDKKAFYTGNIFIEFECSGKPSGINATEASHWAFETKPEYWILIPIDGIRKFIKYRGGSCVIKNGGDYNLAKGLVVSLKDFNAWMYEKEEW